MSDSLFSTPGGIDPEIVEAAREELRRRLPELRELPGFPIGSDEAILKMSVPPYFTACPNPFIEDWLDATNPEGYDDREYIDPGPFAADLSVGKSHLVYKAHAYPTKVPHEAIVRYLLHYTEPGDVVLDGFGGTGMTGVAAQVCGSPEHRLRSQVDAEQNAPHWGRRRAVVTDLSPSASYIAAGLNLPLPADAYEKASKQILDELDEEWGWMYETTHNDGSTAKVDYTIWSEVFTCPRCGSEVVFYDAAFQEASAKVAATFDCDECGSSLAKDDLDRRHTWVTNIAGDRFERIEFRPVRIHYRCGGRRFSKVPDESDHEILRRIRNSEIPPVPEDTLPIARMVHGSRLEPKGFTAIRHLWGDRALAAFSVLWNRASRESDPQLRMALLFWIEQAAWGLSWMNRYRAHRYSQTNNQLMGVYYIPSLHAESSPFLNLTGRIPSKGKRETLNRLWKSGFARAGDVIVGTGSSSHLVIPDESIDYVFVDPPFGSNIPYADLGLVVESWHSVVEAAEYEAAIDHSQGKDIDAYQTAMRGCFAEFHRVLKPGRWMTVEFSNSSNEVWLAIQEALSQAGFVTADTRVFDKKQGSYRQVTAKNAVKRDLIISAYKPSTETEKQFELVAGTPDGAWEFVREHLSHLAISEGKRGEARMVRERMADRLYDRMVAYHVHRGVTVPLTAGEFYAGLEQRFPVRDDMYFLSEQVEAYERHRMTVKELVQAELFITNEQSAVQWLRQFLKRKPRTYAEIQPAFFSELQAGLPDWEALPELRNLLEESFLQDDQGRWYVPDPKKAEDLEKLRTRALLREFEAYREGKGKLARFRSEAARAGFKDAWARRDFVTITAVGKRLPDDAFVEDEALLYYYDNARRLAGEA